MLRIPPAFKSHSDHCSVAHRLLSVCFPPAFVLRSGRLPVVSCSLGGRPPVVLRTLSSCCGLDSGCPPLAVRLISASVAGRLPSVCVWVLLSSCFRWHFGDCQLTTRVLLSVTSVGSEVNSVVRLLAACFPLPLRLLLGCVPLASRLRFDCIQFSVHCCFCLLSVRVSQSLTLRC